MATLNAYSVITPQITDKGASLSTTLPVDKEALDSRYSLEHISLVSGVGNTTSGRHAVGKVPVVFVGYSAPSLLNGALWYEPSTKYLRICNGTNWEIVLQETRGNAQAQLAQRTKLTLYSNSSTISNDFETNVTDTNTLYNNGLFTVKVNGIYFISISIYVNVYYTSTKTLAYPGDGDPLGLVNWKSCLLTAKIKALQSGITTLVPIGKQCQNMQAYADLQDTVPPNAVAAGRNEKHECSLYGALQIYLRANDQVSLVTELVNAVSGETITANFSNSSSPYVTLGLANPSGTNLAFPNYINFSLLRAI